MVEVILPDGTKVSDLRSNANVIADKDNYSGKRKGEIIFDATRGKYYGNHAEDGATPDWQEFGADETAISMLQFEDDSVSPSAASGQIFSANGPAGNLKIFACGALYLGASSDNTYNNVVYPILIEHDNVSIHTVLNMFSHKISSLAAPTLDTDAATKKYVDDKIQTGSGTLAGDASGDINMNGHVLKDATGSLVIESATGVFTFRKSA